MRSKELIDQFCKFRGKCTTDDVVALRFAYEMLTAKWISVENELPSRSILNNNLSVPVITLAYEDDGCHYYVELNRYHYRDGRWLYSQAKYWMPFWHPEKGEIE